MFSFFLFFFAKLSEIFVPVKTCQNRTKDMSNPHHVAYFICEDDISYVSMIGLVSLRLWGFCVFVCLRDLSHLASVNV